jgi:hypothetical protein
MGGIVEHHYWNFLFINWCICNGIINIYLNEFIFADAITQNAQATPVGTSIHTCIATDADLDIVTYSVTISPTTDSFDFNPGK